METRAPHFSLPECEGEPFFDEQALRRIQACLTACEGFSTEDLEGGIIDRMRKALIDVVPLIENLKRKGDQPSS